MQTRNAIRTNELTGSSRAIVAVRTLILSLVHAPDLSVLITGPTGAGKEVVALTLHRLTTPHAPFEAFHCPGHPAPLFESALFGHEHGSFTGATSRRLGACEIAGDGTLFLDEIGDTPVELQAKLLRVLETRQYRLVGANVNCDLRARIVAATNVDLGASIREKRFRLDLFHRLATVTIRVPGLNERPEDIPDLISAFCDEAGESRAFADDAVQTLSQRWYEGHIRELRAMVRKTLALVHARPIHTHDLLEPAAAPPSDEFFYDRIADSLIDKGPPVNRQLHQLQRALTVRALARAKGIRAGARLLGIDPATFRYPMHEPRSRRVRVTERNYARGRITRAATAARAAES